MAHIMIFKNSIQEPNAYIIIPSREDVFDKSESRMLRYDHVTCCKANKKGMSVSLFFLLLFYYDIRYSINFYFIRRDLRQRFRYVNLARILFI